MVLKKFFFFKFFSVPKMICRNANVISFRGEKRLNAFPHAAEPPNGRLSPAKFTTAQLINK